jgi:hypothetical protein
MNLRMETNITRLRELHGFRCPNQLANCSNIHCGGNTASQISGRYPRWCVRVTCIKCCKVWHVCKECAPMGKQNNRLTRQNDLKRHNEDHNEEQSNISSPDVSNKRTKRNVSSLQVTSPSATSVSTLGTMCSVDPEQFKTYFTNKNANHFFKNHLYGMGKESLTTSQLTGSSNPSNVSLLDSELHLLIASLLLRISKGERYILSEIMSRVVKKIVLDSKEKESPQNDDIINVHHRIPIPSSFNDFRRYIDGSSAILNHVPIPDIYTTADGDSYVLPSQVLKLYFAMGLKPHMIKTLEDIEKECENKTHISEAWHTRRAKSLLLNLENNDPNSSKVLLGKWSDACDPNGANKNNRGSVHAICFSLFSCINHNDHDLSFPMALSKDKNDHKEIWEAVNADLKNLEQPTEFFDGTSFFKLQVIPFVDIQDRPERSSTTGYGYHNGSHTLRWGWISAYDEKIISCEKCLKHRMEKVKSYESRKCAACFDWDYTKIKIPVHKDYPIVNNINFHKSRPITFNIMNEAVKKTIQKINEDDKETKWSAPQASNYLKLHGLNGPLIDKVNKCKNDEHFELIKPAVWNTNSDFNTHIEATMHLIFLGNTETVCMLLKDVLTKIICIQNFINITIHSSR